MVPAEFSTVELKPSQSVSSVGTGQGGRPWLAFGQVGQLSPASRTPSQSASSAHGADVGSGVRLGVGVWAEVCSARSSPRTGIASETTAMLSQSSLGNETRRCARSDGIAGGCFSCGQGDSRLLGNRRRRGRYAPSETMLAYRLSGYKILRCRFCSEEIRRLGDRRFADDRWAFDR